MAGDSAAGLRRTLKGLTTVSAGAAGLVGYILTGVLDLVYPPACAVCGSGGDSIVCATCRSEFRATVAPVCARCGGTVLQGVGGASCCRACDGNPPSQFTGLHAAGVYEGALRDAVLALKYGRRRRVAEVLGDFLADSLFGAVEEPGQWVAVPVPLHPSRLRERGFNQSELLARVLRRRLGCEVDTRSVARVRRTRPQASLPAAERAANIRDAFAVRSPSSIQGRRVLLVDDVVTTLNTVAECVRVLRDAGAAEACVVAAARGGDGLCGPV